MFASSDLLPAIQNIATVLFCLALIWILGRMGDNVNKIRKLLEQEFRKQQS